MASVARRGTFSSAGRRQRFWVYMSLTVVTPARAISHSARTAPSVTDCGVSLASMGKTRVFSQVCSSMSSAPPRKSTIGRWVCPLTRPGMRSFLPLPSTTRAPAGSASSPAPT